MLSKGEHTALHNRLNKKGNTNRLGKTHSEESKKKMSEARMGKEPWNKGLTAESDERVKNNTINSHKNNPGSTGHTWTWTDEQKEHLSASLKGLTPWNKGKKTGQIPWNKGRKFPGRHWKLVDGKRVYY